MKKVERLLYLAEYKRRQAAPGVKISARNFGRDRRYPITNRFREDIATEVSALGKTKAAALSPTSQKGETRHKPCHRRVAGYGAARLSP